MSDTEVISQLIDEQMEQGKPLLSAIQTVCETKLMGTWRLALLGDNKLVLATNSGDLFLGRDANTVVFCTEAAIQQELKGFSFEKLKQNVLYEICFSDLTKVNEQSLIKQIQLNKQPKSHSTFLDEIKAVFEHV